MSPRPLPTQDFRAGGETSCVPVPHRQNAKIDALGIRSLFDLILLTDAWGREFWKPHPRAFQAAVAHFGLEPGAFVYVSDNPAKDFLAPNALGWHTVRIRRPGGVYAGEVAPPGGEPRHTISTLDELVSCATAL